MGFRYGDYECELLKDSCVNCSRVDLLEKLVYLYNMLIIDTLNKEKLNGTEIKILNQINEIENNLKSIHDFRNDED